MKNLNKISIFVIIAWLITFLLTFDAAVGSYQESEPHAGNILFVAAGILLFVAMGAYLKFRPTLLKK